MTRAEITRLAKAKWGKSAFTEENKRAPDPETRAICCREYEKLKEQKPVPPPPTPEELRYQKNLRIWKEQMDNLRGRCMSIKRYRVGKIGQLFAHIEGDGDSWEEAAQHAKLIPGKTDS